jgi:hypothetical protein
MIIFARYYTYETTPTLYPGGEGASEKISLGVFDENAPKDPGRQHRWTFPRGSVG